MRFVRMPQLADQRARNPLRVVEAALAPLGAIERNRDDQDTCTRLNRQLCHGGCQPPSQWLGDGLHAVVLQQVDEAAQLVFIASKGDGLGEPGGFVLAQIAEPRLIRREMDQ